MRVCRFIELSVCTCITYIYMFICINIYIYIYMHTCTHMFVDVCVCVRAHLSDVEELCRDVLPMQAFARGLGVAAWASQTWALSYELGTM